MWGGSSLAFTAVNAYGVKTLEGIMRRYSILMVGALLLLLLTADGCGSKTVVVYKTVTGSPAA